MSSSRRSMARALGAAALPAIAGGCRGVQNALDPAGPQAQRIGEMWWWMLTVFSVVFLLVLGWLIPPAVRALRTRSTPDGAPDLAPDPQRERRLGRVVAAATALTVIILFAMLLSDFKVGRAIAEDHDPNALTIAVTGHQWWWEVQYLDSIPSLGVTTANEIHIPVGRSVRFRLTSHDVIHSFWVPNLHGKRDLIPGYVNELWMRADRPGVFRGQCAEFCGLQHAHMSFLLIAEPPERFRAWLEAQRRPAREPTDALQARGREVFLGAPCVMCHAITGTSASGRVAPDLTHFGSRRTIGAGTVPNTPGYLGGWIVDAQSIKPGNQMPQNALEPRDLQALIAYLESLN